jgi:hypothetical protein
LTLRVQREIESNVAQATLVGFEGCRGGYTVRERWCNEGRIECEKDPANGKWRIPGHEFRRLVGGGALKAKQR